MRTIPIILLLGALAWTQAKADEPTWWLWSKAPAAIAWSPAVPADSYTDCVDRLLVAALGYFKQGTQLKCEVKQ